MRQGLEFHGMLRSAIAVMFERPCLSLLLPTFMFEHGMVTMAANDSASVEHVALPVAAFAIFVVVGVANHLAVRVLPVIMNPLRIDAPFGHFPLPPSLPPLLPL